MNGISCRKTPRSCATAPGQKRFFGKQARKDLTQHGLDLNATGTLCKTTMVMSGAATLANRATTPIAFGLPSSHGTSQACDAVYHDFSVLR